MKVLICSYDESNKVGGPWTWLTRFVHSLRRNNIDVAILFFLLGDKDKCLNYQHLKSENFEVYSKKLVTRVRYYDNTEDRVKWILKVVEKSDPSIFIPNLVVPALFAAKWIKMKDIPTIGILHSDDNFYKELISFFAYNSEYFSAIVAVSDKIFNDINKFAAKSILKYKIPYLIPTPPIKCKYNKKNFRIAFSGRFENEQKRIRDVIFTFASVTTALDNVTCHLYGAGSQLKFIQEFIIENGLQNKIYYEGNFNSDELQSEMVKNNVITLLSDYEGIPIAILEAMAVGLIPVCKYIESGLPEIVKENQTGYLLKNYKNEYIDIIRRLSSDKKLFEKLSGNSINEVKNRFSYDTISNSWIELFNELLVENHRVDALKFNDKIIINDRFTYNDIPKQNNLDYLKKVGERILNRIHFLIRDIKKNLIVRYIALYIHEIVNFVKYFNNYFKHKNSIFLIYTVGKVGSSTLHATLKAQLPFVSLFNVHYLGEYWLNKISETKYKNLVNNSKKFIKYLRNNPNKKLKIITGIREPISRDLSHFFQDFEYNLRHGTANDSVIENIIKDFKAYHSDFMFEWWERDFKEFTQLDILSLTFNKEKGYTIYEFDRFDLLIIKQEYFKSTLQNALQEYTGILNVKLKNSNITSNKKYAHIYNELRNRKLFSRQYLDNIYDNEIVKHFYLKEEVKNFKSKWS